MDRTEEIKNNLAECQKYGGFVEGYIGADDVSYLLERVSQLEQSKDRTQKIAEQLAKDYQAASERISQLERENEKLRNDMLTARLDYERW